MTSQAPKAQYEKYGSAKAVNMSFAEAVERTKVVLGENGWGVMSEIDIKGTMKQKMGVDVPAYTILGTCNPILAKQALEAEPNIGLLMPCNAIIYEKNGGIYVSVVDAEQVVSIVGNAKVDAIAKEANQQLRRALDAV